MIGKYLGEFPIALEASPLAGMSERQLALEYVFNYGQSDGAHHKQWVLDQVARILNGAPPVNLRVARWDDGTEEFRYEIGESTEYHDWVLRYKDVDENGEEQYSYDEGTPRKEKLYVVR